MRWPRRAMNTWQPAPTRATCATVGCAPRSSAEQSNRAEILVAESEAGSGEVFLEVCQLPGARNRQHHRRFLQQPGDGDLSRRRADFLRCRDDLGSFEGRSIAQRIPGQEGDAVLLAMPEHVLRAAIIQ